MIVKPDPDALLMAAKEAAPTGLPPVHLWNPPYCGEIDIRIARDGTWIHEGRPIRRAPMVRMFSGILRREGDRFYLVTPVEKVGIMVEDAPFVATDFEVTGTGPDQTLIFTTQVGDSVAAGPGHPIRVAQSEDGEPSPYVMVRDGLEALIDRKSFYRLIDLCVHEPHAGSHWFGVRSGGAFFPVVPSADLP